MIQSDTVLLEMDTLMNTSPREENILLSQTMQNGLNIHHAQHN